MLKKIFFSFKSINLFDKYANYLEDYLKNKKINISINKKYYKYSNKIFHF